MTQPPRSFARAPRRRPPLRRVRFAVPWLAMVLLAACGDFDPALVDTAPRWSAEGPVCGTSFEFNYRPASGATLKDFSIVHDGERFHLFAMQPRGGWLNGGATTFAHASSTDLVTWDDHAVLDLRRPVVAEDNIWAPHVVRHENRWWMFYTGVSHDEGAPEYNVQRIVSAVSDDLEHWTATPYVIEGDPTFMQWGSGLPWGDDLRDGMLWRDGDRWILFATVRLLDGDQCIAMARSTDLRSWQWIGPLTFTKGRVAESPTMVRFRDRLWLFWTSRAQVLAASAACVDCEYRPEPFELIGYANEALALADGSVLVPRIRADAVAFARMLPDPASPPRLTTVVSPLCFDGSLLIADPTVIVGSER